MRPQDPQSVLRDLEAAASEHLRWLEQVHAALLFGARPAPQPLALPDVLQRWVDAPEVSPQAVVERGTAVAELRQARQTMNRAAAAMVDRVGRGGTVAPAEYHAFMAAADAYGRALRHIEGLMRQAMAETDPLTGVHNRLGMMRDLQREWQRAMRTGQPCCVALVDLDHFKAINDTYGHRAGDMVLSMAARFFVRRLRPYDRVYRYGGEEFLFCLPDTDLESAERVLDRLRGLMARLPVALEDGRRTRVTASFGIATMDEDDADPAAAIERADRAVYAAKHAGRNKVCIHDGFTVVAEARTLVLRRTAGASRGADGGPTAMAG